VLDFCKEESSLGRAQNLYGVSAFALSNDLDICGDSNEVPVSLTNLTYSLNVLALSLVPNSIQTLIWLAEVIVVVYLS